MKCKFVPLTFRPTQRVFVCGGGSVCVVEGGCRARALHFYFQPERAWRGTTDGKMNE